MLQHTLDRMQQLVPPERTLVVVSAQHREESSRQLAHWPQQNIIYQPANRDTAPGILLPLSYITHWDPSATIIVSPSDHFVRDENRFMEALGNTLQDLKQHPNKMVLLGMTLEQGRKLNTATSKSKSILGPSAPGPWRVLSRSLRFSSLDG